MPELIDKNTGKPVWVSTSQVQEALASGKYESPEGLTVAAVSSVGAHGVSPDADISGFRPETPEESAQRYRETVEEEEFGGVGGGAKAFGAGALRGLSLGGSDWLLKELGVSPEDLEALRRVQSKLSLAGEIGGAVAPALVTGGAAAGASAGRLGAALARTPAGLLARGGAGVARLGGRSALGRVAAGTAAGTLEGMGFGAGQAFSDAIIEDKPLTADAFVASVRSGALYGGAFGAGAVGTAIAGKAATRAAGRAAGKIVRGAKAAAGKVDDATGALARKVDDAIKRRRAGKSADDLLSPPPREVAAEELTALRRVGDDVAEEARAIAARPKVKRAQRMRFSKRADDIDGAATKLQEAQDAHLQAGTRESLERQQKALTEYHESIARLSDDLTEATGKVREVPPNPAARLQNEAGSTAAIDEILPKTEEAQRAALRGEVRQVADDLDQAGTSLLEEGRQAVEMQRPIAEIGGKDLAGLMDEVTSGARLQQLVAKVERAQQSFRSAFKIEPAGRISEDAIEAGILKGSRAEATQAVRALRDYNSATRSLAEELDRVVPVAAAPPRAQRLPQALSRTGKETPGFHAGWDAGDTLAMADLMGLEIEDIPLIGQIPGLDTLLQARLAYRRFRGGAEKIRMLGAADKVGGIASRAQKVRQVLTRSVEDFVKSASPRVARSVVPAASTILHSVSYGAEPPPENETKEEAFERVANELTEAAQNPELQQRVRERLGLDVPDLVDPIAEAAYRKILYLAGAVPKDPRDPAILQEPWQPDDLELDYFAEKIWAAENPTSVLGQMAAGELTPEGAEAIREVYPALFGELQQQLIGRVAEAKDVDHDRQVQMSALLGVPVSSTESPLFVAAMQAGYQSSTPGPKPTENVRMKGLDQMEVRPAPAEETAFDER